MGDFWKPTAEMYSSLFEKPKMAEKLLIKPPFKYIYDIIAECSKVTGFAKGLYTGDELTQEYYESKDRKMAYLQKMIDLVQLMSKEEMAAKPGKIVAGLEPEHTNTLLQSIYKLATGGVNSDPFVKKVLGGGAAEKEKPKEAPKKADPPAQQPPPAKQPSKPKEPEKKPEPKPEPKQEPPKKEAKKPDPPKFNMSEQEAAPKVQVTEATKVVRPPSAKKGGKPSDPPVKPTPPSTQQQIIDDDDADAGKPQVPKKANIEAANYSKKVKDAMDLEDDTANANQDQAAEEEPTTKYQMGNLRKNKRESTQVIKGATGGQITEKELEVLKGMIQTICQNSTPLGKSIEFINDDIESMNQQLLSWRKQYNQSKGKMQNELKLTEDALVPLYDKLAEIDEQMKDQKGKIQNMKTQIIKNQSTIKSLLYSVVTTKS